MRRLPASGSRPLATFSVAGFPVVVRPLFLLVTAATGFEARRLDLAAIWVAVVFVSVLWHELGHALAMRRFGHPASIELYALGGLAHWPDGAAPTPRERLWVSAAGPGAGLLLGAAVWQVSRNLGPVPWLARVAVSDLLWVNVGWSLVNLLPVLPLDGSGILDASLALRRGRRRLAWTGWVSAVTGGAVAVYAAFEQRMWLAFIGGAGLLLGVQRIRLHRASRRPAGDDGLTRAQRALAAGDLDGAAGALLPLAWNGRLGERNLAELVRILVQEGRAKELVALVRERLRTHDRRGDAEPLARLASEALGAEDLHREAFDVDEVAFRQLRIAHHAYDAAGHLVALRRHDEAVAWLADALAAGLDCRETLAHDPAFEALRGREDFRALLLPQ